MVFNFAWFGCWNNPKTFYWLFHFVKWLFSRLHGFFSTLIKTTYFAIHLLCHPSNFYKISQWCTTDREKKIKIKKKLVTDARSMKHEAWSTKHEARSTKHEARWRESTNYKSPLYKPQPFSPQPFLILYLFFIIFFFLFYVVLQGPTLPPRGICFLKSIPLKPFHFSLYFLIEQ